MVVTPETDYDIGITRPTITIVKKVGCGSVTCVFVEHNNGNFHQLLIYSSMSKNTPCGASFIDSFARIMTWAMRRSEFNEWENGLAKQVLFHRCNKLFVGSELSCSDAIGKCLKQYIAIKKKETAVETKEK